MQNIQKLDVNYPRLKGRLKKCHSNSSLNSDTKKCHNFSNEKNVKVTKLVHVFKSSAIFCYVKVLNSFNPELKIKDTEPAIKILIESTKRIYICGNISFSV